MELRIRFTIQLKFIYSICQTLCSWPGLGIAPSLSDGGGPPPALPVRLQEFGTSPAHHRKKTKVKSRSCTTKIANVKRIYYASRRTTLANTTPLCSSRTCLIRNMSKSETDSQENHGTKVKQNSSLNRETRRNSLPSGPSESEGSQEMVETPAVLFHESPGPPPPVDRSRRYTRILVILFLCTLPLVNPIVHGDGVGYYAYIRAPLIQHNLRFEEDWRHANLNFSQSRTTPNGELLPSQYTETGYVSNQFTIGPALLWAPLLVAAHGFVLIADARGAHIPADGFSFPYLLAMALGTAIYGFLGLFLSYSLARKYVWAHWAFLATLGIWGASSLPVYMYFNPAWSHAQSAFAVALFLWYWDRTWGWRTLWEWALLGFLAGLMIDVYFPNGALLALIVIEFLYDYWSVARAKDFHGVRKLFVANLLFLAAIGLAFVPTLITRAIVFGGFFRFGSYSGVQIGR